MRKKIIYILFGSGKYGISFEFNPCRDGSSPDSGVCDGNAPDRRQFRSGFMQCWEEISICWSGGRMK